MKSPMEQVILCLQEVFRNKGLEPPPLSAATELNAELGLDSLDYAELIMEFEQDFNIRIPDNDAEQLQTVSEIVEYVEKKLKKEGDSTSHL